MIFLDDPLQDSEFGIRDSEFVICSITMATICYSFPNINFTIPRPLVLTFASKTLVLIDKNININKKSASPIRDSPDNQYSQFHCSSFREITRFSRRSKSVCLHRQGIVSKVEWPTVTVRLSVIRVKPYFSPNLPVPERDFDNGNILYHRTWSYS